MDAQCVFVINAAYAMDTCISFGPSWLKRFSRDRLYLRQATLSEPSPDELRVSMLRLNCCARGSAILTENLIWQLWSNFIEGCILCFYFVHFILLFIYHIVKNRSCQVLVFFTPGSDIARATLLYWGHSTTCFALRSLSASVQRLEFHQGLSSSGCYVTKTSVN